MRNENLMKPHVRWAVERQRARVAARVELSTEQVLADIAEVGAQAVDAGEYGPALRGQELLGNVGTRNHLVGHRGAAGMVPGKVVPSAQNC